MDTVHTKKAGAQPALLPNTSHFCGAFTPFPEGRASYFGRFRTTPDVAGRAYSAVSSSIQSRKSWLPSSTGMATTQGVS